jgi:hypothetical protein
MKTKIFLSLISAFLLFFAVGRCEYESNSLNYEWNIEELHKAVVDGIIDEKDASELQDLLNELYSRGDLADSTFDIVKYYITSYQ